MEPVSAELCWAVWWLWGQGGMLRGLLEWDCKGLNWSWNVYIKSNSMRLIGRQMKTFFFLFWKQKPKWSCSASRDHEYGQLSAWKEVLEGGCRGCEWQGCGSQVGEQPCASWLGNDGNSPMCTNTSANPRSLCCLCSGAFLQGQWLLEARSHQKLVN